MLIDATKTNDMFSPFRVGAKAPSPCFCGISNNPYDPMVTEYKFNGK